MMTKDQVKVFEELLKDKSFRGKQQLKHLLWLNTVEPKYKIGDCFKVTDYGHRVYGHQIINFNAKVTQIKSWRDEEEWCYQLDLEVECDGKRLTTFVMKREHELQFRCDDNKNVLGEKKSTFEESIEA